MEVEVLSIDEQVESGKLRPPNFVMIDVEGSEIDVLRGMTRTIREHRPVILCEVHWLGRRFRDACAELVVPAGYSVRRLDGDELTDAAERFHVVLLPE